MSESFESRSATGAAPLLRTPEAARYLGLAKATLVKWRCLGGGPPFRRFGRAVVYDGADLQAWAQQHRKLRSTCDADANDRRNA